MNIGSYNGMVAEAFQHADFLRWLEGIAGALDPAGGARVIAAGRHLNVAVEAPVGGVGRRVLVKRFGRQTLLRNLRDRDRGSKAKRTWTSASRLQAAGVCVPVPMAFLDRWDGARLTESYVVTEYLDGYVSFRDALIWLFQQQPECARFMDLLQVVADAVRGMHEAGFSHHDLGNQNVLLRTVEPGVWTDPRFIDLNRGRWAQPLSLRARGRDLSRLTLPSDFWRVFLEMYWRDVPPAGLLRWESHYRWRYAVHAGTRHLRHPRREARIAREEQGKPDYPAPRDLWVWDERSGQAVSTLLGRDRSRCYPWRRQVWPALDTAVSLPGIWREYRRLRPTCFQSAVDLGTRIGMSLDPHPDHGDRELALLAGLGRLPVLIRFHAHEDARRRDCRLAAAHTLRAAGHDVMAALVQDRRAVRDPAGRWRSFASEVLSGLGPAVREVEVSHGLNRVKWGIWDPRELQRLQAEVAELAAMYPRVSFTGPAGIDFEYPFVVSALRRLPAEFEFSGLSHHLYVDRRGAPENTQGPFSTVDKCALARAIARHARGCADRFLITGVNWPLLGTGVYSPVGAPYASPGVRRNDPSVSEDDYTDFMIRYLCLTLCSGVVDRVYWWRLVARGFGLVDDTDPGAWRPRPAYRALKAFVDRVGEATFVETLQPPDATAPHGLYQFHFQRPDGERLMLLYAHGPSLPLPGDLRGARFEDVFGEPLASAPAHVTGRPLYVRGCC